MKRRRQSAHARQSDSDSPSRQWQCRARRAGPAVGASRAVCRQRRGMLHAPCDTHAISTTSTTNKAVEEESQRLTTRRWEGGTVFACSLPYPGRGQQLPAPPRTRACSMARPALAPRSRGRPAGTERTRGLQNKTRALVRRGPSQAACAAHCRRRRGVAPTREWRRRPPPKRAAARAARPWQPSIRAAACPADWRRTRASCPG